MSQQSASLLDQPATTLEYQTPSAMTHFRWVILGLVFLGTTVNYMDRLVLSILAPDLRDKYHFFTDAQYGTIQGIFALAYALGQMGAGRWIDWIGTRVGYALSLFAWSITSILHVLARTALGFGVVRVFLGIAESPNFPAAVKTLAEWFPRRERAFAMGVVNAGVLLGAILVPATVPFLAAHFGWRSAFVVTGSCGMVWLMLWLPFYRLPEKHPRVSAKELAHIHSDPPEPAIQLRWLTLLTMPQAWAFMIGKLITDPLWWFYMTWFPNFFRDKQHLNLTQMGLPLVVIYVMAAIGSMGGGWLSSFLIQRGWSVNASRKTALFISALVVIPMVFTTHWTSMWIVVPVLGLAVAGHQGFSSNLYTLVSDLFPRCACGSVSGLGGSFGYGGATLFSILTGLIVGKWTNGNYTILFVIAGLGYLVAFLVIHLLAPRLEPAQLERQTQGVEVVPATR
jgi:ACS family hexuronate transporter-like MFS transporter